MQPSSDDLLTRLRTETEALHARVELAADLREATLPRYRRFVAALAGFVPPLEQALRRSLGDVPGLELHARGKAALLAGDLDTLDTLDARRGGPVRTATAAELPVTDPESRAWGVLYVLEGSTLGGQLLRRQLARTAPGGVAALRYLDPYGPRTGQMWRQFRAALGARADGGAGDELVVAGARDAFERLAVWLEATR